MRKIFICVFIMFLAVCNSVMAKQVTVTGSGDSVTEAENDALRNAVENVMGVLVESQTLVEQNTIINDSIYTNSKGFIKDYTVTEKRNDSSGWLVTVMAEVDISPDGRLMSALVREGIIVNNMRNPRIAVIIPEEHLRHHIQDPAGETAVIKKFLEAGFQNMIEVNKDRIDYNQPFNLNAEQMQNLANSMQADILVVGQAFSECAGDIGQYINNKRTGLVSCKARVEAKMYIARTGQILAADGTYGSAVDIAENIASKKALANAGEKMGDYLAKRVVELYSGNKQLLEITVLAGDINNINRVKTALNNIRGIKSVNFNSYVNGHGVLSVQYSGSPQTLFKQLQQNAECSLELREVTFNTLTIVAY